MNSTWLKPVTYGLVFLIAPLLAYYLLYVQSRTENLISRYYAHLTNITVRTEARFNSVSEVIENACADPGRFPAEINGSDLGLTFEPAEYTEQALAADCSIVEDPSERLATFISQQRLEFSFKGGSIGLVDTSDSESADTTNPQNPGSITINVNPRILIGNIDQANRFHDIFIFDDSGNVVFQKRPENGRIESDTALFSPNLKIQGDGLRLLDDPLADLRTELFGRQFLRMSQPLQLGFEFPSQSIEPQNAGNEASPQRSRDWRVVGLIDNRSFNSDKLEFQPETVAWTGLVVTIIVLLAPVLKLSSLGSFESFKKFDIVLLLGSFFTLTTLLSLVVLEIHMRSGMNNFMGERLQSISNELKENLEKELHYALTELDKATEKMYTSHEGPDLICAPESESSNESSNDQGQDDPRSRGDLLLSDSDSDSDSETKDSRTEYVATTYPYFKQVFLIDANGCQILKWSTHSQPSNRIIVKTRNYFQRSKPLRRVDPELFSLVRDEGTTQPFFLEFITSRTTGEKSVALSMPVKEKVRKDKCLDDKVIYPCVSAMTLADIRTFQATLPFGFGFALINKESDILFHHEGNANTELNLAAELGDDSELQAVVYGGSEAGFEANYHGKKHRFRLIPLGIEGAGLSLVTFYAHDITVLPLLEAAGVALFLWVCWFSLLLSLAMLLWQLIKHFDWPFFDGMRMKLENRTHWYIWFALPLTAACFIIPGLYFICPVLIASIFVFWLFRRGNQIHGSPLLIVTASCVIILVTTSLPIFGFLRLIQAEALTGVMQLHIRDHIDKVEEQRLLVRDWIASRDTGRPYNSPQLYQDDKVQEVPYFWQQHALFGLTFSKYLKADFFVPTRNNSVINRFDSQIGLQSSNDKLSLGRNLLSNLPNNSEDTNKLHAMYGSLSNIPNLDNSDGYGGDAFKIDSHKFQYEITLGSNNKAGWAYEILAAFFLLTILFLALWYVLVRILGLRQEKIDLEFRGFVMPDKYAGIREIVYGLRRHQKMEEFKSNSEPRILWIDLLGSEPAEIEETVGSILADFENPEKSGPLRDVLIFDHFDHGLDKLSVIQQRTALMENVAATKNISVVILMEADPFSKVNRTLKSANADKQEMELILKLTVYLSEFHATYFREPQIEENSKGIAIKTLREECIHPNLRSIYYSIRKQKNLADLDKAEIIQIVKRRADAIYGQMWLEFTNAEKIVLVDLAREHLVNPNALNVARQLMQLNFLQRAPFYRIFSESFKQFVLERAEEEDIESIRKTGESVWLGIRTPFVIFIAAVVTFLGATQPSFFNSMVAFGTAAAAALPFLANLIMSRISAGSEK